MNCPVCGTELKATDRQGIEIDCCPRCRGVWLDRGELEKIIDRSSPRARHDEYDDDDDDRRYAQRPVDPRGYSAAPERKRKGFLSELFDFD